MKKLHAAQSSLSFQSPIILTSIQVFEAISSEIAHFYYTFLIFQLKTVIHFYSNQLWNFLKNPGIPFQINLNIPCARNFVKIRYGLLKKLTSLSILFSGPSYMCSKCWKGKSLQQYSASGLFQFHQFQKALESDQVVKTIHTLWRPAAEFLNA